MALRDVWTELERRFGNTAATTNVLVQRLLHTSRFEQGDSDKRQRFADVCADVDSQVGSKILALECYSVNSRINKVY